MSKRAGLFIFFCLMAVLFWTCRNTLPAVSRQNLAVYYQPSPDVLQADYVIYHFAPDSSRLYFKVNASQLLYVRELNAPVFSARLVLRYVLHPVNAPRVVADSGHVVLADEGTPGEDKLLSGYIDMQLKQQGQFVVEVSLRDLNKMTQHQSLLYLDHETPDAAQRFLLCAEGSAVPLFRNYADSGETVQLSVAPPGALRLQVRYHKPITSPAVPPFSITASPEHAHTPDSTWWITTASPFLFRVPFPGYYTFHTSASSEAGILLSCLRPGYPKIGQPKQLLEPLRYLTSREEYAKLAASATLKTAVDEFWLDRAGSEERAREVIRQFYSRVERCNQFFTADREGWQTDRGMIYLLFGVPQSVYRYPGYEVWYYGTDFGSASSLSFTFNYFTEHGVSDYLLERTLSYKINWLAAVDSWRQGQVYTAH